MSIVPAKAGPMVGQNAVPIMDGVNFPDPSVIGTPDGWHMFSTNAIINGKRIHIQRGYTQDWTDFKFSKGVDALPTLPAWVDESNPRVWAPNVSRLNDGSFVIYYTAAYKVHPNLHCLSVASAKSLDDVFVDDSQEPWICPIKSGGAIDPAGFVDEKNDGRRWLMYKIDGNSIGHGGSCGNTVAPVQPTPIMLQQIGADGHALVGGPIQILSNIASDGPYVEAPSLTYMDGKYVLFFSSKCYQTPDYNVQYAIADNITGPYMRAGQLFQTGAYGMTAPGGLDVAINGNHTIWHGYVNVKSYSDIDHFGSMSPAGPAAGNGESSLLHDCRISESEIDCRQRNYRKVRAAYVATLRLVDDFVSAVLH